MGSSSAYSPSDLGLWPALYLGRGERTTNQAKGRPRFMACAVEAIIGAVHLDAKTYGAAPATVGRLVASLFRLNIR